MKNILSKLGILKQQQAIAENESSYTPLDAKVLNAYNKFRPAGKQKLFCYVPFTNMTFSFKGKVLACAYNQKVVLGNYPQNSVREMWFNSEMGQELRSHMEHNDLSFGCKHCKYFAEHYKFSGLKPLVFDKYHQYQQITFPKVLEFELSNICNFECVMCNGEVSSSIRKNRDKLPPIKSPYDDDFVLQLEEFIPHLDEAKFYGGEPFYNPLYFKIWETIIRIKPSIKIFVITNGSILTPQVKSLLEKGNFEIGVSMDALKKDINEAIRLNVQQDVLLQNITYFNQYMKSRGKQLNISFTMMRINYQEFEEVLRFCNQIDALLYVSYLKTPSRFAIWNLPATELQSIQKQMEKIQLPVSTNTEKFNHRCLKDFITYLEHAAQENIHRSEDEIVPVQEGFLPGKMPLVLTYDSEKDYKALLKELFHFSSAQQVSFFDKIENAAYQLSENAEVNRIYYSIINGEIKDTIQQIEAFSIEELKAAVKSLIFSKSI